MHYYKRNIGDYHKKAGRLSMLEHGSYTLLIDACYDREQFPTLDEALDWCWARNDEEIAAVKFVLSKFFTLENGVYVQNRIKEDLEKWRLRGWFPSDKRIARKRLPTQQWLKVRKIVFARDNYTCVYCMQKSSSLECDHIHPISRGGTNELTNLATACKKCNRKKSNKIGGLI